MSQSDIINFLILRMPYGFTGASQRMRQVYESIEAVSQTSHNSYRVASKTPILPAPKRFSGNDLRNGRRQLSLVKVDWEATMKFAHFFKFDHLLQGVAAVSIGGLFIAAGFMLGGEARPFAAPPQIAAEFGGVERYLVHVSTDKPIYRSGERLYVRGVFLRATGHTPMTTSSSETLSFEIKGPKGDTVASGVSAIIDTVAGFSWDIPAGQAGGEYTVRISHPAADGRAERKFDIRAYRAPRLKSQIVFVRNGYGPGDMVAANLHVERAEGGIPAGAKVSVSARVDGEEAWKGTTIVDSSGNAGASFRLPAAIARGEGVIAMIIEDGGTVETATKTIPILLQTLDLGIYPEGGDLIAGLPNRVYVVGQTPARKPADMAGVVVNAAGRKVATFHTEHEGRGRFSFVPVKGEAYSLRITEPAGIKTVFASGGESIWCRHFIDVRYHTQVKGCRRPGRRYIRWLVSHRVKPARKRTRI